MSKQYEQMVGILGVGAVPVEDETEIKQHEGFARLRYMTSTSPLTK
jgi:hypothetical protein